MLGLPVVLLGFANPDCQAHAPNESMILANYEGGLRTVARYWAALGEGLGESAKGTGEEAAGLEAATRR